MPARFVTIGYRSLILFEINDDTDFEFEIRSDLLNDPDVRSNENQMKFLSNVNIKIRGRSVFSV